MATNIGAKVELDGEKEFRQALKQIDAGLKATASELTLVTTRYTDNAKSVQALTEKKDALQKMVAQQTEKISKLSKAIEDAKPLYEGLGNKTSKLKEELALAESELESLNKQIESSSDNNSELQQKHKEQTKAVEDLKKQLAATESEYRQISTKTLEWQNSLNLAQTELIKTNKELDENSEALEQAQKDMEKFGLAEDEVVKQSKGIGSIIGDLTDALGIDLPAGADKAIQALDGTKVSTLALVGAVTGLITGFAKTTIETAQAADEILTLSAQTGLATDTIQKMNYASELLDVSTETITGSMAKMIRSMNSARDGTGDAAEAFRKLHVRVTDNNGQLKDSETVFYEVIDALGQMKNETERDAAAMAIFGKSAQDLNPLIKAGSKGLKELGDEAERMGYIMDGDALDSLGQLDDAMQRFNNQTTAFKNQLAMVMLPVLTSFFEILNKIDPKIIATVAIIGSIAAVAVTVAKAIKDVSDVFKALKPATEVAEAAAGAFNYKAMQTTMIVLGVVATLIALAAIIAVISGKSSELNSTMKSIGDSVGQIQGTVNNVQSGRPQYRYVNGSHASGLDYVPYDGYIAELHRGERIQTAAENPYNGGTGGGNIILNVRMSEVDEVYKLVNTTKRARQMQRAGVVMV